MERFWDLNGSRKGSTPVPGRTGEAVGLMGRETVSDGRRLALFFTAFALAALAFMFLMAAPAWAQAVLEVEKTDAPDPVKEGELLTYTIVVENTGDADATNVRLDDTLGASLRFVSASTTKGSCPTKPAEGDPGGLVSCNLGTLAQGVSATVTIEVRPTTSGSINNSATATADGSITATGTEQTRVVPNLVIAKIDEPERVNTGGLITYTLRVTNEGRSDATNVVVRDDLPLDDVDYRSVESASFRCTETAGLVECTRATLLAGETRKIEIVVKAKEEGTVSNTARVSAGGVRIDEDTEETRVENASTTGTSTTSTTSSGTNGSTTGNPQDTTSTSTGNPQDTTGTSGTSTTGTTSSTTGDPQAGVIKDTIPKGTLADTGGASATALLFGMALLFAGAATWTFRRFF